MSANTVNQIIELLDDGYTSCTISKYAMREIKELQEKSRLITHVADVWQCEPTRGEKPEQVITQATPESKTQAA